MPAPQWWLRLLGEWKSQQTPDFAIVSRKADEREERIRMLELRVLAIEQRLRITHHVAPTTDS